MFCFHKDPLPEDALVTHVITCQGRDHIVNVQSGRRNLVVAKAHFELDMLPGMQEACWIGLFLTNLQGTKN